MPISRRLLTDSFTAPLKQWVAWFGGERARLPMLDAKSFVDDGRVVYEGVAVQYFLEKLPEYFVTDAFSAGDRAAIETHSLDEKRSIWLARFEGDVLRDLGVTSGEVLRALKTRERYSTPPPWHPDYFETLGFRPSADRDDGLPDGERLTDGKLVLSLLPAIGQSGWIKVGNQIHVLGSRSPAGAQVWAIQRGVPFGQTRNDRLADLEVLKVSDEIRSSQVLSSIAETRVTAKPGLLLKGVDVAWHVHDLWRASMNSWFEWQCWPARCSAP